MRLKTRLVLAFLAVAWIPLAAVVWVLTDRVDEAFRGTFEARVAAIEQTVRQRLGAVDRALEVALERIAALDYWRRDVHPALARDQFYGADIEKQLVQEGARELMISPALDTLRVVDVARAGHVVAMGHRRAFAPTLTDPEAGRLARERPDGVFFRREPIEGDELEEAEETWTLQRVALVLDRLVLVGGIEVDASLLKGLAGGEQDTHVALTDASGERIAATFEGAQPEDPAGYEVAETPFRGTEGAAPVATLRVYVGRGEVAQARSDLWTTAGLVGGASGLIALLAGFIFSRRLSKPLERLAEAASDVAAGARDRQVIELRGRDEVARLTRAFNQMTLDLSAGEARLRQSERVAAWREIARRIAHEIKNPLFPIQMSIETLKKVYERDHPDFDEIFKESTATILEEVERMKRIVSEFSNFARMPAPRPRQTDLAELIANVVQLMREAAPPGVALTCAGASPLLAEVDPDQLRQALMNLVKNAIEAVTGEGARGASGEGKIEVRAEPDGERGVRIVVTDNGPGMAEETRAKLFVPYFTTKAEGTGLGLAIVHRIVEEHDGVIQVDSREDVGTRFVLRLPRVAVPREAGDLDPPRVGRLPTTIPS